MKAVYGCHNRQDFKPVVITSHGQTHPFTMNPDCQYTKTAAGQSDPKCHGCNRSAQKNQKQES